MPPKKHTSSQSQQTSLFFDSDFEVNMPQKAEPAPAATVVEESVEETPVFESQTQEPEATPAPAPEPVPVQAPEPTPAPALEANAIDFSKPTYKFISLGSGSSGNCAYLGVNGEGILIDAGVAADNVVQMLRDNGITMDHVHAIILTHDHGDHVRYAYNLARSHKHIRIYSSRRMLTGMLRKHNISRRISDYHNPFYVEMPFKILNMEITAFPTNHDGTENFGFSIVCEGKHFVVATDMGSITDRAMHYMKQANFLMLESNYDGEMLDTGHYPEYLKNRIRNAHGHLSNIDAAKFLSENYSPQLKYVFLCHLSHDNNTPEIALATNRAALESCGATVGDGSNHATEATKDVQLYALPRFDASLLFHL